MLHRLVDGHPVSDIEFEAEVTALWTSSVRCGKDGYSRCCDGGFVRITAAGENFAQTDAGPLGLDEWQDPEPKRPSEASGP